MKVVFLLVDDPNGYEIARIMVDSVRRHMDCDIVQMTGKQDPAIPGCTPQRIPRNGDPLMLYRMRHLASLVTANVICLDTDIYVQTDLSKVFAFGFDVALTWRQGPIYDTTDVKREIDLAKVMPYNNGVMFSRNPAFWRECYRVISEVEDRQVQNWYGDQWTTARVAPSFNVLKLHCDNFNYTPKREEEDVSTRLAVHYKGERKQWMIKRGSRHLHES